MAQAPRRTSRVAPGQTVDPLLIDYQDREWGVPRLVARHSAIALARFRLPLTWKKKCVRNSYPYATQKVVMRRDEAFVERDLKD